MENQLKVAVELQEGEKSTKKIWRFNADLAAEYTKIQMEKEKNTKGAQEKGREPLCGLLLNMTYLQLFPITGNSTHHYRIAIMWVPGLSNERNMLPEL